MKSLDNSNRPNNGGISPFAMGLWKKGEDFMNYEEMFPTFKYRWFLHFVYTYVFIWPRNGRKDYGQACELFIFSQEILQM